MASGNSAADTHSESLRIVSAGASNKGVKREINEDAFSCIENPSYKLYLVADGLGGPKRGAVASNLALSTIRIALKNQQQLDLKAIESAVSRANKDIFEKSAASATLVGMGTTLVGLGFVGSTAYIVNVGNSRAYRYREGTIARLTIDDTVTEGLREEGVKVPTPADAKPTAHLLTRSLGTRPAVDVDYAQLPDPIQSGDLYLLCSDGLYDLVSDAEIAACISSHALKEAVYQLIDMANNRGGHDNITAVLVQVGDRVLQPKPVKVESPGVAADSADVATASVAQDKPAEGDAKKLRASRQPLGPRAPRKTLRHAIPGRELLDLRERDGNGEVVRPGQGVASIRVKPPLATSPISGPSGTRGAQRLRPARAISAAPLTRRLPPLNQKAARLGQKDAAPDSPAVGLLRGNPDNIFPKSGAPKEEVISPIDVGESREELAGTKVAQAAGPSSQKRLDQVRPGLLTSQPTGMVPFRVRLMIAIGCGVLGGGILTVKVLSSRPRSAVVAPAGDHTTEVGSKRELPLRESSTKGKSAPNDSVEVRDGVSDEEFDDIQKLTTSGKLATTSVGRGDSGKASVTVDKDLESVKSAGTGRVRDSVQRAMLVDVIEAIQEAIRNADKSLQDLANRQEGIGERLESIAGVVDNKEHEIATSKADRELEKKKKREEKLAAIPTTDPLVLPPQTSAPGAKKRKLSPEARKKLREDLIREMPAVNPLDEVEQSVGGE